jgi:hypothetical protein
MDKTQLDPLARMLVGAYLDTASHNRAFMDDYGQPPTAMALAHHIRSIVQARVTQSTCYKLTPAYVEFGRVQVTDLNSRRTYLLRSLAALAVENRLRDYQRETLFPDLTFDSDVVGLVYRFHAEGLDLAVAGTRHDGAKWRLRVLGVPTHIGTWPYVPYSPPPFDQDIEDPFTDIGSVDFDDEAEEQ